MAFTGTPTIVYVSDRVAKITGLSLAASAAGTIGLLANASAEVKLPAQYTWSPDGSPYGLVDLVEGVLITIVSAGAATTPSVRVVGTGGTNVATALWTLTNNSGAAVSGAMDIYIQWLG